jgi:hypothetical protein
MDNEEPWVNDPLVLLWQPKSLSPFTKGLSAAARLNAHARLTILLGLVATLLMRRGPNAPVVLFLTVILVVGQGVEYEEKQARTKKEISEHRAKHSAKMADPSRAAQHVPANMSQRSAEAHMPYRPSPSSQVGATTPALGNGMSDPSVEQPVAYNPATIITQRQQQYTMMNHQLSRAPTRFDVQNQGLPIGGMAPPMSTSYQVQPDLGRMHPNAGPFNFGDAVNSVNPQAYTYESNYIERMMRPVDEVDPGLVTNPLPDPTFMSRMPTFDKSHEYEAEQRMRMQRSSGAYRFW